MGTSNWQNISYVIELIRTINPTKILDFGVGFGRWGILCREFLEIWDEGNYSGNWRRQIDGVEVFSEYIKPYHKYFYDTIYNEEGYSWIKNSKEYYNLIIFGDVIEHFEKQSAIDIINLSLNKSDYILINLPLGIHWEQSNINDNKYEVHKSIWDIKDFNNYDYKILKIFNDNVGRKFCVTLISKIPISIHNLRKQKYGKYYRIRNKLIYSFGLRRLVEFVQKLKN